WWIYELKNILQITQIVAEKICVPNRRDCEISGIIKSKFTLVYPFSLPQESPQKQSRHQPAPRISHSTTAILAFRNLDLLSNVRKAFSNLQKSKSPPNYS